VTPALLSQAIVIAGSVLALWLYVRLGAWRPSSLVRVLIHVGVAVVLVTALHATIDFAEAGRSSRGVAALFALFLPAMTYSFLCALYLLEHLHRSLSLR
jgi:hypothetical protein